MRAHLKDMGLKALLTMPALFALLSVGRTGQCSLVQQIRPPLRFLMFLPSQALAASWNSAADVLQLLWFKLGSVVLGLSLSLALNSFCKPASICAVWDSDPHGAVPFLSTFSFPRKATMQGQVGTHILSVRMLE